MNLFKALAATTLKTKIILGVTCLCVLSGTVTGIVLISKDNHTNSSITKQNGLEIQKKVVINVNEQLPSIDSFIKNKKDISKNLKLDYGKLKDTSELGIYQVVIIDKKTNHKYNSKLEIIDNIQPELTLKDVSVEEGNDINITDFINSCTDNSKKDCSYYYVNDKNEKITDIDKSVGKRKIWIIAEDINGNKTKAIEANLEVTEKSKTENNQISNNSSNNQPANNQVDNDPEKGCYVTLVKETTLAYRFNCGMPSEQAYNIMLSFREHGGELSNKLSKVNDGSGHAQQLSAGYSLISAKYNYKYAVGIEVNIILIDPVDKVSSYGYLKEDGSVNWIRFRQP